MNRSDAFCAIEDCLTHNPGVSFWWRDDDVSADVWRHPIDSQRHFQKLQKMLFLVRKHSIEAVFSVIPNNFTKRGARQIRALKRAEVYVALHGIHHHNNGGSGNPTEFPEQCDMQSIVETLKNYKEDFAAIFDMQLVPIFVPPWNTLPPALEDVLLSSGFTAISRVNVPCQKYSNINVDIDINDWKRRALRDEVSILQDIIGLIRQGRKSIGLMGHHKLLDDRAVEFLDRLFAILASHQTQGLSMKTLFSNAGAAL